MLNFKYMNDKSNINIMSIDLDEDILIIYYKNGMVTKQKIKLLKGDKNE